MRKPKLKALAKYTPELSGEPKADADYETPSQSHVEDSKFEADALLVKLVADNEADTLLVKTATDKSKKERRNAFGVHEEE